MHFSTLFTSAILAAGALAVPGRGWGGWNPPNALSPQQVKNLIDGYTYLLVNPGGPDFNSTANAILAPEFIVFSDSILTLQGRVPDGSPAFVPGRQGFIDSQFQTPPLPVLKTLDYFYSAKDAKIGWRWRASGIGSNQYSISGLIDFDLDGALIKNVYSEFNSAAFLVDLGVTSCKPPPRS